MTTLAKNGLTCLSCRLIFENGAIQKHHYLSEWHFYNVKRKVAGLPPVSENDFVNKQQHISQNSPKSISSEDFCSICHKKFQSEKAYENHLNSKKHRQALEAQKEGQIIDSEENNEIHNEEEKKPKTDVINSQDEDKAIPVDNCLFCNSTFQNMESSIKHMSLAHGFFIPDRQYCADLQGLIKYLGMKIGDGKTCILCNSTKFLTIDALQKHMRDKNHCIFRIDETEESILEFMDFYDYSEMYEEEDDAQNITLYDDGFFLTLPSGARIGHRSLMRYFKQSLKPTQSDENGLLKNDQQKAKRKQIGFAGGFGDALSMNRNAVQLATKDIAYMERKMQNYRLKLQTTSNKLFISRGRKDQM